MYNFEILFSNFIENIHEWNIAIGVGVLFFVISIVFLKIIPNRFFHSPKVIKLIPSKISISFLLISSVYLMIKLAPVHYKVEHYAKIIFLSAFWIQFALIVVALINLWLDAKRNVQNPDGDSLTMFNAIGIFLKLATTILCILILLQTLGFNVSTLIAGLGIGGIAAALAAQNILGDLFASVSILLDKPFVVGDLISTNEIKGTVEHIGLKTTILRSEYGEQIICSNSSILKNTIKNYKRINEHRIVFQISIIYEIEPFKIDIIPKIVEETISKVENCRFERAYLKNLGDSGIIFEISYMILEPALQTFQNTQGKVNTAIFKALGNQKIDFAYPTQTIYNKSLALC